MESDKHNQNKDRLDQWINGALREYGNAEPCAGLERRILANLESREAPSRAPAWAWAFAAATLMAGVVLMVWIGTMHHRTAPVTQVRTAPLAHESARPEPLPPEQTIRRDALAIKRHIRRPRVASTTTIARGPRLETFPSPRPLSEQEQMLVGYVRHFPQEALLVAQRQARDEEEMQRAVEGSKGSE
jgi:hypothetical protein